MIPLSMFKPEYRLTDRIVQMLTMIAEAKHESLIAVGSESVYTNPEIKKILGNRVLALFITLPIHIFEEIQKAITSMRQTAVAA